MTVERSLVTVTHFFQAVTRSWTFAGSAHSTKMGTLESPRPLTASIANSHALSPPSTSRPRFVMTQSWLDGNHRGVFPVDLSVAFTFTRSSEANRRGPAGPFQLRSETLIDCFFCFVLFVVPQSSSALLTDVEGKQISVGGETVNAHLLN